MSKIKGIIILFAVVIVLGTSAVGGAVADRFFNLSPLDQIVKRVENKVGSDTSNQKIVREESVVVDVADSVSPSVVTVSIETPRRRVLDISPFGGIQQRMEGGTPQDIGTGFIISEDGLIVTNKHVVSSDGKYKVITSYDAEGFFK